jgi:predicted dehydrogenase
MDGPVEGVFHSSWASLLPPWGDLAVFGNRGALTWRRTDEPWPFGDVLGGTVDRPDLTPLAVPASLLDGLQWATTWREYLMGNLVRQFVAEVLGLSPMEGPTFTDGYRVQLVLDAIARSLVERRWVTVPA